MRLLIIGQLRPQVTQACKIAARNGAKVLTSPDIESAMDYIRSGQSFDLVMIDVNQDIKRFIVALESERIHCLVYACGIESDKQKAVQAIKAGAKDYVPLPPEEDLIAAILESICNSDTEEVVYASKQFEQVIKMAAKIAPSEASVLISGESGTGKEVISKYIHKHSKWAKQEMIAVNCAAIPENLLESELFGHEKGAFTGAVERRVGKFEQANNSTILLDEISEMDLRLQAKLLRVIQEREVCRVGGNAPIKLNIRIIATTNRDMNEAVKNGDFREDLYYRLNVINIELPSLRERIDDIEPLVTFFVNKYSKLNGVDAKALNSEALQKLKDYSWPGNIRELENVVHRALLISEEMEIVSSDIIIPKQAANCNEGSRTLEEIERNAITVTLSQHRGDAVKAAMLLGISLNALKNKLKQYKISA